MSLPGIAPLGRRAFRSRWLAERLFGGRYAELEGGDRYFDATTLTLRACLPRCLRRDMRVLEVGSGSFALLAAWLAARVGCEVCATELDAATAERARAQVDRQGAAVDLRQGAFFGDFEGPFDAVIFNPPYVPTRVGQARGLSEAHRAQWDGGDDGTRVLAEFLEALQQRTDWTRAFLGVNGQHVSRERVLEFIGKHDALGLAGLHERFWSPSTVYELEGLGA